jgi:hypothetical protein
VRSVEGVEISRAELQKKYQQENVAVEKLRQRKVFVVGWHRTGTRSLKRALDILGFKGIHWWPGWLDLTAEERHSFLDKYDAFADFPFPLVYRELDLLYPGAKFILTTRSPQGWLRSVKEHFDDAHWNRDGVGIRIKRATKRILHPGYLSRDNRRREAERMFTIAYGNVTFDSDIFLERFIRHNEDVSSYFAGRHKDFLTMNLETNFDWDVLCSFLRLPKPKTPYPHLFSFHG